MILQLILKWKQHAAAISAYAPNLKAMHKAKGELHSDLEFWPEPLQETNGFTDNFRSQKGNSGNVRLARKEYVLPLTKYFEDGLVSLGFHQKKYKASCNVLDPALIGTCYITMLSE